MTLELLDALIGLFDVRSDRNAFAVPPNCTIKPQLVDITMNEILRWRSRGATKRKSAAHVAILYLNPSDQRLYVAMHQRSARLKNGGGRLGWPGGIADDKGESIFECTAREVKEECLSGTAVAPDDLRMMYAKKSSEEPLNFYALFVLFIADPRLITGPDADNEWEVTRNASLGMTEQNGFHNLFSFSMHGDDGRVALDGSIHSISPDALHSATRKIWNARSMKTLFHCVGFGDVRTTAVCGFSLCRDFGSAAGCRYGQFCRYSHARPNHIRFCRDFRSRKGCRYGSGCRYRHDVF